MNWAFYILAGLVVILTIVEKWWDYLLKYIFSDGRKNDHKTLRKWLFWLTLALFSANQIVGVFDNHQKTEKAQRLETKVDSLTNQLVIIGVENLQLRDEINQGFRDISHEFSTNGAIAPIIRLAVLDTALEQIKEEGNALQKEHELFDTGAADIKTLREERKTELNLQENQKRQTEIQQEKDDIQNKKIAEEAGKRAEVAAQNQKLADQELLKSKMLLANQILPIFDYIVRELDKMLANVSKQSGEKRFSDFSGATPTVYASSLVKDGIIIDGANSINIGTNSAWDFRISTTVQSLRVFPQFYPFQPSSGSPIRIQIQYREPYVSFSVASHTTNGESILTVTPYRQWNSDVSAEDAPTADRPFYEKISIKLTVPNGLNIDELQPSENYKTAIDKALRRLIEAQDQQFPLGATNQP